MNRWLMTVAVAGTSLLAVAPQRSAAQEKSRAKTAQVTVHVPSPNAELWFNGVRVGASGTTRTFTTPPLRPGQDYHYRVRARWMQNSLMVDAFRTVSVAPGQDARVDFRGALSRATTRVYVPVTVPEYVPVYQAMSRASDDTASAWDWRNFEMPEP